MPTSEGGAHWRNMTNTTELYVCGNEAALCQITWTNFFFCARSGEYGYVYYYEIVHKVP